MFPDAAAASTMRDIGVTYVVVHAGRAGTDGMIGRQPRVRIFSCLRRFDQDYSSTRGGRHEIVRLNGPAARERLGNHTIETDLAIVVALLQRSRDRVARAASSMTAAPTRRSNV